MKKSDFNHSFNVNTDDNRFFISMDEIKSSFKIGYYLHKWDTLKLMHVFWSHFSDVHREHMNLSSEH